ncbi:hypothetical protein ISN45_Aa05g020790 [Arabidopsis thaliana x Arabidopsis arenosa]|uniref:Uncharacterized protein n=1 Tax=Arabidopsis thaliana x Arabidopsis arenosa TaxID=1240361 RepID=A0A8T1ZQT1_9BRAS|nr:hypothetical protein ISN45_Aa05g020790 [Arabidopsis thaliana x Arabidopsis arenosa]
MAEEAQDRANGSDSSPPIKLPPFITNLFSFLQPKPPPATIDANAPKPTGEKEPQKSTYETVSFPYNPPKTAEPIKFEAEPSPGRTSNSVILWQVYALGGFLVLKWAWARWNERNERSDKNEATGDDDQPSNQKDDDDQSSDGHED